MSGRRSRHRERQNCELERENGGECYWSEKAARNGAGTVVETLAQDWSSMDREMQCERTGGHQRSYAQLGWTCGKAGLQRNLCDGLEMPRPSMVAIETASTGKKWRRTNGLAHTHNGSKSTGGRTWLLGRSPNLLEMRMVAFCSKPWKLEAIFEMWNEPCIDGPGCLEYPSASGMTDAVLAWLAQRRIVKERVGEHLLPLSRYQANYDIAVMLSWYSTGYGWLGSSGSWYERRGSWGGQSEVRCDVEWFCRKCGTKVLRWNVAGGVFLSLISSVRDLNPGMTDFVHVGELILRPQLTDDLNDFISASTAHVKVTNTWMNTHTHTHTLN